MKKLILLLCLLLTGIAPTLAQTDTIRFALPKYQTGSIEIFASSDTVKFSFEKKGERPIVYTITKEGSSFYQRLEGAAEYKIYDIQGKIATFYALNIESLELNNCANIDTLEVEYPLGADVHVYGLISVTNCRNLKKIKGSNWGYWHTDRSQDDSWYYAASRLTIRNCDDLASLVFTHCKLDIDNESCHNLQELDCRKGVIAALDFKSCDSLKTLNCYATNLKALNYSLDLSNCTRLEELDCSTWPAKGEFDNAGWLQIYTRYTIWSLNVNGCINLKTLNCNNQAIEHLDVSSCSNLKYLSCQGAVGALTLTDIRRDYYSKGDGRLKSLNITGCYSLQYINCDHQPLDSLDASNLTNLRTLVIPRGDGGDTYALKKLNVSGCTNLIQLDCSAFRYNRYYSDDFWRGRLQYLDASGCTNLESLDLSYMSQIETLRHLDVSGCTKLKKISAGGCGLTFLDVSRCDSLRYLFCHDNQLSALHANGCTSLSEIEAQNNALPLSECYALPMCERKLTPQNIYINCSVDSGLDLRGEMSFNGYTTSYSVKLNDAVATEGKDYTLKDSMVNFLTGGNFEIMLRNTAVPGVEVYYHVTVPNKVQKPWFRSYHDTLAPGSEVPIFCSTENAKIYYTLDGTDPSDASLLYYNPIELNVSTTIKAIAVKYGWTDSEIVTATFVIKDPNDDNGDDLAISPLQPQLALNAYPNPCGDILYIETSQNDREDEIHAFRILDLQGREQVCAPGSIRQIDMSRLPAGVYLLEATGKNGAVCRHKIIKR